MGRLRLLGYLMCRSSTWATNRQKSLELLRTIYWCCWRLDGLKWLQFLVDGLLNVQAMRNQLFLRLRHNLFLPSLLANPLFNMAHERRHHVELVRVATLAIVAILSRKSR